MKAGRRRGFESTQAAVPESLSPRMASWPMMMAARGATSRRNHQEAIDSVAYTPMSQIQRHHEVQKEQRDQALGPPPARPPPGSILLAQHVRQAHPPARARRGISTPAAAAALALMVVLLDLGCAHDAHENLFEVTVIATKFGDGDPARRPAPAAPARLPPRRDR